MTVANRGRNFVVLAGRVPVELGFAICPDASPSFSPPVAFGEALAFRGKG
jgi:hypothetical protein